MQSGISSGHTGGVSSSTQMRWLGHFLSWQAVLFPQRAVMSLFLRPRTKVALHSPWQESTTHLAVGYRGHCASWQGFTRHSTGVGQSTVWATSQTLQLSWTCLHLCKVERMTQQSHLYCVLESLVGQQDTQHRCDTVTTHQRGSPSLSDAKWTVGHLEKLLDHSFDLSSSQANLNLLPYHPFQVSHGSVDLKTTVQAGNIWASWCIHSTY